MAARGTDERWRIFHQHHPGLVRGWLPLQRKPDDPPHIPESEPAFCWGVPPTGAWGRPEPGAPRPLLFELTSGQPGSRPPRSRPAGGRGQPPRSMLFDWGRDVAGYLTIELPPSAGSAGRAAVHGRHPARSAPRPAGGSGARPAGAAGVEGGPAGPVPLRPRRRDRGSPGASVQPVDAAVLPRLLPGSPQPEGVFGATPPPLRTPVEDEVWRKLQRVPGVAGRKKR